MAEGVEELDQVKFLQDHHSDQVQGYYYSKPLSEAACIEFLKNSIVIKK